MATSTATDFNHRVIEALDKLNGGEHAGFRPAHAKGIMLTGVFTPSSEASSLTRAPHIGRSSTPVTVRFSNFAGVPTVADNDPTQPALGDLPYASISPSTSTRTSSLIRTMASRHGP